MTSYAAINKSESPQSNRMMLSLLKFDSYACRLGSSIPGSSPSGVRMPISDSVRLAPSGVASNRLNAAYVDGGKDSSKFDGRVDGEIATSSVEACGEVSCG